MDVGEDGGAAWGDAALLEGEGKVPELGVEVGGGFGLGEILREERGKIGGVVAKCGSVTSAEGGVSGRKGRAALAAGGSAVLTAILQSAEVLRVKGFVKHSVSFL